MTASMSVSRSLPGSSSTRTLGSSSNTQSSARRRRWPPERSLRRVSVSLDSNPRLSRSDGVDCSFPPMTQVRRYCPRRSATVQSPLSPKFSSCWSMRPMRTDLPRLTVPARGRRLPSTVSSSVVFPAPLAPRMPMRSPGPMSQSRPLTTGAEPEWPAATPLSSKTCLPRRATERRLSSSSLRRGGSSARASLMRNLGLEERAWAPRESQASSRRSVFWRRSSVLRAWRSRSTRCWM